MRGTRFTDDCVLMKVPLKKKRVWMTFQVGNEFFLHMSLFRGPGGQDRWIEMSLQVFLMVMMYIEPNSCAGRIGLLSSTPPSVNENGET